MILRYGQNVIDRRCISENNKTTDCLQRLAFIIDYDFVREYYATYYDLSHTVIFHLTIYPHMLYIDHNIMC